MNDMEGNDTQKPDVNESANKHLVSNAVLLNIEAAIKLIPYAGGFLATYFGEIRGRRSKERMQEFFNYFTDQIKALDDKKLDKEYLNSEDFAEYFMQGAEEAVRSTTQRRIRRFANILINNALLGAQSRSRTQSIMSFVDRISDLDSFILLCYGNPKVPSLRAATKNDAYVYVKQLAEFLALDRPDEKSVMESIVYMDNLGITWVNEIQTSESNEKGKDLILKEFSSFRSPLGDALASVIAPPGFFRDNISKDTNNIWPEDHISEIYRNSREHSLGETTSASELHQQNK